VAEHGTGGAKKQGGRERLTDTDFLYVIATLLLFSFLCDVLVITMRARLNAHSPAQERIPLWRRHFSGVYGKYHRYDPKSVLPVLGRITHGVCVLLIVCAVIYTLIR
jgi:hypothetical protein